MKKLNRNLNLLFILMLGLGISLSTTSCKTEGCTNPNAENFDADADDDDGSCVLARVKFIGTYNVNETCTSGTFSYAITVSESTSDETAIVIGNFGGYGVNVRATVAGSNITYNDTQDGITFSGSGSISGNTLTIIYTASAGGYTDDCTKTCIKQ